MSCVWRFHSTTDLLLRALRWELWKLLVPGIRAGLSFARDRDSGGYFDVLVGLVSILGALDDSDIGVVVVGNCVRHCSGCLRGAGGRRDVSKWDYGRRYKNGLWQRGE